MLVKGIVKPPDGDKSEKEDYFISRLKATAIHTVQYNAKLMQATPKLSMRLLFGHHLKFAFSTPVSMLYNILEKPHVLLKLERLLIC
jgi:hypothetical protein